MRFIFRARSLFLLSVLFIAYATTIPWDLERSFSLDRLQYIPFWDLERGRHAPLPDILQNIVLFAPLGFFGWITLARHRRPVLSGVLVCLLGFSLSLFVETLQTMSLSRSPSTTDLATNFLGTLLGAALAGIYETRFSHRFDAALTNIARTRPGLIVLSAYLFAVLAGSLAPFIPSLDIGLLRATVRRVLDNPWGEKPIGALATEGLLFAALAFLMAHELPSFLAPRFLSHKTRILGPSIAGVGTAILAIVLEGCQLLIVGHSAGLKDALVASVGAMSGAALAFALCRGSLVPASAFGQLTRRMPWLVVGFSLLAPTARALQPFQFTTLDAALDKVTWAAFIPFASLFSNINVSTFWNVFEASAYYVPLGYAFAALDRRPTASFISGLLLAEALEVLQIPVVGRTFDLTEGIYAGAFALVGAWALSELRTRA